MPELPEVETVLRTLEKQLKGQQIEQVKMFYSKILDNIDENYFIVHLPGQHFVNFERRGKYLLFVLDDYVLVVHLRMEGKFYVYPKDYDQKDKHTHVIFYLNNMQLHYNDVRKFGRFYLYKKGMPIECINKLGYEPFDENLTGCYLKKYNRHNHQKIKTQLLDQEMIAGIGNIYADEICFQAQINPLRQARFISGEKYDQLINACRLILKEAIKQGGTTIRSYTSSLGVTGLFQLSLKVHNRENENCYKCGNKIIREKVNGRSTYYCPYCQKNTAIKIAVTGSIGSGKSTVMEYLKNNGYKTVNCDEINRQLLSEEDIQLEISKICGCPFDKKVLIREIFGDTLIGKQVQTYLHQMIYQRLEKWLKDNENEQVVFAEVPLLFEYDWDYFFDYNVAVITDKDKLYERLKENRQMNEEEITERLNKQLPAEIKKERADFVIENNDRSIDLEKKVQKMLKNII
ncbi:MAG: bifunctional DNA-formamidopyrimidine glycosylase/DNA-(apurinic or apyrimidinic site) lyase [Erysipelotrichia bacterium]|nr:bifunctional DNA-formamidopyrimidine glycosylase/DNA-(apurinic or apyrimidinic site) lyase [Erysipelotrichia bacterium]